MRSRHTQGSSGETHKLPGKGRAEKLKRTFSRDARDRALKLIFEQGRSARAAAKAIGVHPKRLLEWARRYRQRLKVRALEEELIRTVAQNALLVKENKNLRAFLEAMAADELVGRVAESRVSRRRAGNLR